MFKKNVPFRPLFWAIHIYQDPIYLVRPSALIEIVFFHPLIDTMCFEHGGKRPAAQAMFFAAAPAAAHRLPHGGRQCQGQGKRPIVSYVRGPCLTVAQADAIAQHPRLREAVAAFKEALGRDGDRDGGGGGVSAATIEAAMQNLPGLALVRNALEIPRKKPQPRKGPNGRAYNAAGVRKSLLKSLTSEDRLRAPGAAAQEKQAADNAAAQHREKPDKAVERVRGILQACS